MWRKPEMIIITPIIGRIYSLCLRHPADVAIMDANEPVQGDKGGAPQCPTK